MLSAKVPVRLTEPCASHAPASSGPRPADGGAGGDVWLNAALADLNFVRFFFTEMATGNTLRPLLPVSASAMRSSKLATADR